MSKLSVHVSGPNRKGFSEYLKLALPTTVFSLNQNVWSDIQSNSPTTILIYRDDRYGSDPFDDAFFIKTVDQAKSIGYDWVSKYAPIWSLNKANYYAFINEPGAHFSGAYERYNAFCIGAMNRANELGLKLALYDWSAGTPDLVLLSYLLPSLIMAKSGGHLLALHEYGLSGGMIVDPPNLLALRYRELRKLLPINAQCNFVITEAGPDSGYWAPLRMQPYIDDVAKYDREVMKDPYVLGVDLFDLGNTESNMQEVLPLLTSYTILHPTPPVVEPPSAYLSIIYLAPQELTYDELIEFNNIRNKVKGTATQSADDAVTMNQSPFVSPSSKIVVYKKNGWTNSIDSWLRSKGVKNIEYHEFASSNVPMRFASPILSIPFRVTSKFNEPRSYGLHEGLDLDSYDETIQQAVNVHAAADGIVRTVGAYSGQPGYGNYIIIDHGYGWFTWYCHLSSYSVSAGQIVTSGKVIGKSGMTGTTAIHLHFNVQHIGYGLSSYLIPDVVDPLPLIDIPVPPPPPVSTAVKGLNMRADGHSTLRDFQCIASGNLNGAKFMTNNDFTELSQLLLLVPAKNVVMRLHAAGDNPVLLYPGKFFDEQRLWLTEFAAKGGQWVEIHNEPNLSDEGFGHWWINGDEFGAFYASVAELIHMNFPTLKCGYPGLSPNTANEGQFIDSLKRLILAGKVDWIGAHSYWIDGTDMNVQGRHYRRFLNQGKPVIITEAANVGTVDSDLVKGNQYKSFFASLEPGVLGAYIFVSSASDPGFNASRQTWVRNDALTDIVRGVA